MTAKDPARRYPTAKAVEADLRAWAAGEPVQPMDNPDDADFLESVAVLQAAESPTDVSFTNLGIVNWKEATAEEEASPPAPWWRQWREKRPAWWVIALLGGLGISLLVELILLLLAAGLLGRR
jgi:hypothetical protein